MTDTGSTESDAPRELTIDEAKELGLVVANVLEFAMAMGYTITLDPSDQTTVAVTLTSEGKAAITARHENWIQALHDVSEPFRDAPSVK